MEGFFTKKETESTEKPDGRTLSCHGCGLFQHCTSPRMAPYGGFKKKILNIGEAPGEQEDRAGKPFQGKTGTLLRQTYERLGVDLFEDCLNINACLCRPTDANRNNRTPTNFEIESCRRVVLQTIEKYRPKVIVLLGNSALYSLIGHRWKRSLDGISKWRGWTIPDQDFRCWICPTFHPSYIERAEGGAERTVWEQDLRQAIALASTPFPAYKEPYIEIITDLAPLRKINCKFAFDFETTGIKPHAAGHKIICCAVADTADHAYVFMMPEKRSEQRPLIELLRNPLVEKVAQNMKFEHAWSLVRLMTEVSGWKRDTMLMSHVLDNRTGITGLKFQTYVQLGIVDYSSDVEPYLKARNENSANAINKIEELTALPGGKEKLMKYCGLDAVYEYRLEQLQTQDILPF